MLLREPIVALADVYYTWKDDTNVEQSQLIERSSYQVRVRHLDGEIGRDSRILCFLEMASSWVGDGWVGRRGGWAWNDRSRNYRLDGVFGYTDGAMDPSNSRADIGRTPAPLAEVVAALVSRQLDDMTLSTPAAMYPGRLDTIRTRDQTISVGASNLAAAVSSVFTGDPWLDMTIAQYVAPTEITSVSRSRTSVEGVDPGW
jgi:hypothetical protein